MQQPVPIVPVVQSLRSVQTVQSRNCEGKKRFRLSVLDYAVTSNHVDLLVKDTGSDVIAQSMQLVPGRRSSGLDALLLKETKCLRKKLFR